MPRVVPQYKQEAKERILNAAIKVFAEKGYHHATMDDVASSIGVSKGAVYLYFRNKEELFDEICKVGTRSLEEILNSSFEGSSGDVRKTAELYFEEMVGEMPQGIALWLEGLAEASRSGTVRKLLSESYAKYTEVLVQFLNRLKREGVVRKSADSESVAGILMALHDGILMGMLQGLDRTEAKRLWVEGVGSVFQTIAPSRAEKSSGS